ncbi:MAG TPA: class I SAM-dependent methyltransferase, partial [Usitatibacteraceae bacterium]|nr:class I SAM-dependent methyltransferase [Usitatibacteraceae bacterium]
MRHLLKTTVLAFAACATVAAVAQSLDTDVPFVTTPPAVTRAMLELARVGPDDYLIDLGSGDGRIVILAARQHGARGLGVEIDPQLIAQSRANAEAAGVAARVEFRDEDLFKTDLSRASVITMYLLPDVNLLLRPKLLDLKPGTRIVSHDWDMGDWQPDAPLTVPAPEKTLGLERTSRVMLWTVPARVDGIWCSRAHPRQALTLKQHYQRVEGQLAAAIPRRYSATLDGAMLTFGDGGTARLVGQKLVVDAPAALAGRWTRSDHACGARKGIKRGAATMPHV